MTGFSLGERPSVISHIPAALQSSDPAMKERKCDRDDQESVKEQWGRTTMKPNDAARGRHEWQEAKKKKRREGGNVKVTDVWRLKRGRCECRKKAEGQEVMFLSFSFTVISC